MVQLIRSQLFKFKSRLIFLCYASCWFTFMTAILYSKFLSKLSYLWLKSLQN